MSVRVWKGGCMVDALGHYSIGLNVVLETLGLYIARPSRRPLSSSSVRPPRPPSRRCRASSVRPVVCSIVVVFPLSVRPRSSRRLRPPTAAYIFRGRGDLVVALRRLRLLPKRSVALKGGSVHQV